MSKDNNERHYGFKHIQPEYSWMTPGWIEELVKHEPDEEVRNYITEMNPFYIFKPPTACSLRVP